MSRNSILVLKHNSQKIPNFQWGGLISLTPPPSGYDSIAQLGTPIKHGSLYATSPTPNDLYTSLYYDTLSYQMSQKLQLGLPFRHSSCIYM